SNLFDPITQQRIVVDFRDARPGDKQYHWEQRGVPFRFEVGPRDVDAAAFIAKGRVDGSKQPIKFDEANNAWLRNRLAVAHAEMFEKAKKLRDVNTRRARTYDERKQVIKEQGGFVRCHFEPSRANEAKIKEQTKATV